MFNRTWPSISLQVTLCPDLKFFKPQLLLLLQINYSWQYAKLGVPVEIFQRQSGAYLCDKQASKRISGTSRTLATCAIMYGQKNIKMRNTNTNSIWNDPGRVSFSEIGKKSPLIVAADAELLVTVSNLLLCQLFKTCKACIVQPIRPRHWGHSNPN